MKPFSEKLYPTEMRPDSDRNDQLNAAIQSVRQTLSAPNKASIDKVPIIVMRLTPSGDMDFAGVKEDEMYFSGSLLKVALLFASFALVARVNEVTPDISATSAADLFAQLEQAMGTEISAAVPQITAGPWQRVKWAEALTATSDASGQFSVTMSARHEQDLRSIFSNQNQNNGARDCMHRLGFSFVNGSLDAAGFFGIVTETGIWMATDYVIDDPPGVGNWPSFNIPVSTNGTSAAAMSVQTMAHLLATIHREELIDQASSQAMRSIFRTGGAWLTTLANQNSFSFVSTGAKVGHSASASAKVGSVMSEAAFLDRKSDGEQFVAVWQNVPDALGSEPIYRVIDDVISNWP
jgi:hypothetical protein